MCHCLAGIITTLANAGGSRVCDCQLDSGTHCHKTIDCIIIQREWWQI